MKKPRCEDVESEVDSDGSCYRVSRCALLPSGSQADPNIQVNRLPWNLVSFVTRTIQLVWSLRCI